MHEQSTHLMQAQWQTRPRILRLLCCGALATAALTWGATAAAQAQSTSNVRPAASTPPPASKITPSPAPASSTPSNAESRRAAKAALSAPDLEKLRPTGTVTVTADRAELTQGQHAIYQGHVALSSDTLKMHGDRLEVKQRADNQFTATLTGNPATLDHAGKPPDDPPVTAHAKTLVFDSATRVVTLTGNAQLTRGRNVVNGQSIRYNANSHRVQASSNGKGQVRMVIEPPPPASDTPTQSSP